jgi:hypothetical protein
MIVIAQIVPSSSIANSYIPGPGQLKLAFEKTNIIDTRGDWQRQNPDYNRQNYIALKKTHDFYIEIGTGYDFSIGYEQRFQKIDSRIVIAYDKAFRINYTPPRYIYDELGRPQLNDAIEEQFYYENNTYYRILPISYSWLDQQIFIKHKLHESTSAIITYQLGYITHTKARYFENGVQKNSESIVFNDPKMGKKQIGEYQINHKLFLRKYIDFSRKKDQIYYDMDFQFITDPDHKLLKAKIETGIGFNVSSRTLLELKCGIETKSFATDADLFSTKAILYNKINRHIWIKTALTKKYSHSAEHFNAIKLTSITTGIEFKLI